MVLHLQDSSDFGHLRNYLQTVGYNEQSVCGVLGIGELRELLLDRRKIAPPATPLDELTTLTHLFLRGESFRKEELERLLTVAVVESLMSLGLAAIDPSDGASLLCPVVLYPVGRLFIVSDRWFSPNEKDFKAPDDIVYPAITPNTTEFLATLPVTPCETFLELCSGTGAVALAGARYARESWAIDITERSTQMAEFNRLLNGLDNVTVLKGNLYEGVEGLKFDRIVAHPPYMPVLRPGPIFYDGGADGEQITRRIVERLPQFMNRGGCFYCLAQGSDRKAGPLENRVRAWLGDGQEDFDVAVVEKRNQDPKDAAFIYALKSKGGFDAVELMRDSLADLGVSSMVYGWIVIQRKTSARRTFTVRRAGGHQAAGKEIAWLLKWETFAANPSGLDDLLEMVPVPSRVLELRTIHRMKDGELLPAHLALHAEEPFAMDCPVDPWVAMLIPMCNGKATVRQLWEACKGHNFIHAETPPQEFAQFLSVLISGGFLEVAGYRPPGSERAATPETGAQDHLQRQAL